MFWSIGPSIHCGLFYLKCLWYAPLASCLIPNVGCYCLCSDEGAGPATFLQSPFWLKLVIFLKIFIQMLFSGSQPIKMMAAYSSVPPFIFRIWDGHSDLHWPCHLWLGPIITIRCSGTVPLVHQLMDFLLEHLLYSRWIPSFMWGLHS